MADSLCGPSNGAKNLVSHINRDRSLQQDRIVGGASHGAQSSFRSQPAHGNGADQAFAGFQQGAPVGLTSASSHIAQLPFHNHIGPAVFPASPTPSTTAAPHGFSVRHAQAPVWANPTASAAPPLAGREQDWVSQFSSIELNNGGSQIGPPAMAHPSHSAHAFQPLGMAAGAAFGFAQPAFASQAHGLFTPVASPIAAHGGTFGNQQQGLPIQSEESSLDVEAFNRAFGAYDDAEFSQELAEWAQKEMAFEAAQDEWMAEHHPAREAKPEDVVEEVEKKTNVKEEAESARRRRHDEELAQAAISILGSVSENDSEKFKNSNFFDLMRRIGNREVVVEGPNLVDATTGETVKSKENGSSAASPPGGLVVDSTN